MNKTLKWVVVASVVRDPKIRRNSIGKTTT